MLLNFPDKLVNLYQIRQWYGPLERIAQDRNVAILCYQPETAEQIQKETTLKVVLAPSFSDLSEVERVLCPKTILYPNQNYSNYRILRIPSAEHIFICHGESDKIYMASNWVKIFNYFFIAGQASKDRLSRHVRNYDVEKRTIDIGRPQTDISHTPPSVKHLERTTVLYAPTWEGGRQSMRYGSVASHGVDMVSALLADERFAVIYRPHPRTGIHLDEFAVADETIRTLIADANARHTLSPHMVDDTPFGWHLEFADVLISDISAVVYDWLTTAKPFIVTQPLDEMVALPTEGFLADTPLLPAGESQNVVAVIDGLLGDDDNLDVLSTWANYYYGNRSPGASIERFSNAIDRVIAERDAFVEAQPLSTRPRHSDDAAGSAQHDPELYAAQQSRLNTDDIRRYLSAATTKIADLIANTCGRKTPHSTNISVDAGRRADVVISTMSGPNDIDNLLDWLPALERLHRSCSVAIITGNQRTHTRLKRLTSLRVLIGFTAAETEELYADLEPSTNIQFEQTSLNLRETTHRTMNHVYVGSSSNRSWINNRLRLFDTLLLPSNETLATVTSDLIAFPTTTRAITLADKQGSQLSSRTRALVEACASS